MVMLPNGYLTTLSDDLGPDRCCPKRYPQSITQNEGLRSTSTKCLENFGLFPSSPVNTQDTVSFSINLYNYIYERGVEIINALNKFELHPEHEGIGPIFFCFLLDYKPDT